MFWSQIISLYNYTLQFNNNKDQKEENDYFLS